MDQEREDYADPEQPRPWWLPSWGILTLIALVLMLAVEVVWHNFRMVVE